MRRHDLTKKYIHTNFFSTCSTWIHYNLCYLTINCDTGQHSQFLRCLFLLNSKLKQTLFVCQIWIVWQIQFWVLAAKYRGHNDTAAQALFPTNQVVFVFNFNIKKRWAFKTPIVHGNIFCKDNLLREPPRNKMLNLFGHCRLGGGFCHDSCSRELIAQFNSLLTPHAARRNHKCVKLRLSRGRHAGRVYFSAAPHWKSSQ